MTTHPTPPLLLRGLQPGDMGWVIHRQTVLYAQEYGWNNEFEALAAEIGARFIREFDPRWERAWIDRKSTRLNSSHSSPSRMPSSA